MVASVTTSKVLSAEPLRLGVRNGNNRRRVLSETENSDTIKRSFVYGNDLDEVLMMVVAGSPDVDHYYAHDHLNSPAALISSSGSVEERCEYDAYGKMTHLNANYTAFSGTPAGNPIAFTGQRLDSLDSGALKLMDYRNRTCDMETGRFLQRDPLGIRDENSLVAFAPTGAVLSIGGFQPAMQYFDGMDLYEYVRSNPENSQDPMGLQAKQSETACCQLKYIPGRVPRFFGAEPFCWQEEISHDLGQTPLGACKCHYGLHNKNLKVLSGDPGECCWCYVTVVNMSFHYTIILHCTSKPNRRMLDVQPGKNFLSKYKYTKDAGALYSHSKIIGVEVDAAAVLNPGFAKCRIPCWAADRAFKEWSGKPFTYSLGHIPFLQNRSANTCWGYTFKIADLICQNASRCNWSGAGGSW